MDGTGCGCRLPARSNLRSNSVRRWCRWGQRRKDSPRSWPPIPRSGNRSSRPPATRSRIELRHTDLSPDCGEFSLVPDPDQDSAFDLELLARIGLDLLPARCAVTVWVQCPVEQGGLQPGNDFGVGGIFAAVGQFLRIFEKVVEHRPEAGSVNVFPATVEYHEQPTLLDRLAELEPDILHAIVVFREHDLAPVCRRLAAHQRHQRAPLKNVIRGL